MQTDDLFKSHCESFVKDKDITWSTYLLWSFHGRQNQAKLTSRRHNAMLSRNVKSREFFYRYEKFFPGTQWEFSATWWWCHTRDPELPMKPRLLVRSCALPSCKFAASRLNIKHHCAHCTAVTAGLWCALYSFKQRTHKECETSIRRVKQTSNLGTSKFIFEFGILTFDIRVKFAVEQMWALKCLRTKVFVLCWRLTPATSPANCRGLRRRYCYLITPPAPLHTSSVAVCLDVNCKLQLCISTSMGTDKVTNHPIAKCVAAASRLPDAFDLTATTSLPLR